MNAVSDPILRVLNVAVVAVIYLFLLRVIRAVWTGVKDPEVSTEPAEVKQTTEKDVIGRGLPKVLRVVEPAALKGKTFSLSSELTLGRAQGCQVSIDDTFASQLHARIYREDGQMFLEDLGSTNGTFLNRKRISAATTIRPGDRLQVGRTIFEVKK